MKNDVRHSWVFVAPLLIQRNYFWVTLNVLLLFLSSYVYAQSFDFGDAPNSYGTLLSSNGARHIGIQTPYSGVNALYLGDTSYDTEADGQPSAGADGDDSRNPYDDENAFSSIFPIATGSTSYSINVQVNNTSGAIATVSGWIDFNKNGVFDSNERAQGTVPAVPFPTNAFPINVKLVWNNLSGLTAGTTYARFRVASNAAEIANPTGAATNGEVEDYKVELKDDIRIFDFGDAPDSYGTLIKSNGARHTQPTSVLFGQWNLDNYVDAEPDGQPTIDARGDNDYDKGVDDERSDNFGITTPISASITSYSFVVSALNYQFTDAMASAWIDFNRNGIFEITERAQAFIQRSVAGDLRYRGTAAKFTWNGLSGLSPGLTYIRLRIASNPDEVANPTGIASDGEVEDYQVLIEAASQPVNTPPKTSGISNQTATVGVPFSLDIKSAFSDDETPNSLLFTASSLPQGLSFVNTTITGTPTVAGSTSVTITASDPQALSVSTSFTLSVQAQTGGALTLTAPTYDCLSGAFRFNTTGGDGSLIEYYAVPGITGWTTNPNQFVDKETRTAADAQPILLKARQNGKETTYLWDIRAVCPVSTPSFAITAVNTISCQTITATERRLTFTPQYAGANSNVISFSVVNEMLPTTAPGPYTLRVYTDNPVITLKAQQGSLTTSYNYNWSTACSSMTRTGMQEVSSTLKVNVLGNPVTNGLVEVEISGVSDQWVTVELMNEQGIRLTGKRIDRANEADRVQLKAPTSSGILLLVVRTASEQQALRLLQR